MAARKNKTYATRATSPAVARQADKRSTFSPVVVKGIGEGKLITVRPDQFKRLDVDPSYQRGETRMVMQIVRTLQAGGKVLDPVTLCQRRGLDTWWVVDGHQRTCAFQQMQMPFVAMLHDSESAADEHEFFIALNSKKTLSANVIVKAWTGPSASMMLRANESYEHPMHGRINFQQAAATTKMAASSLARALHTLVHSDHAMPTPIMLSRIDQALSSPKNKAKAEHFLRFVGKVCPKGHIPALVLRGMAVVANERWRNEVYMPSAKVIEKLSCKHWETEYPLVEKYFAVLTDGVRKIWKA